MRVLVVEDDDAIRAVLERGLTAEGFTVEAVADGTAGLWRALDGGFAAIVLDLLLPGRSGYRVCQELRDEGVTTPILVLSAKSGEYDQIDLLDAGADDYLTKPAGLALIAARLRVLIRRSAALATNEIERGPLRYDLTARRAELGLSMDGFGIQAQAQYAGGTPERWAGHADKWRALGATHMAIATHNAGPTDVDGHLARLREYLAVVPS